MNVTEPDSQHFYFSSSPKKVLNNSQEMTYFQFSSFNNLLLDIEVFVSRQVNLCFLDEKGSCFFQSDHIYLIVHVRNALFILLFEYY